MRFTRTGLSLSLSAASSLRLMKDHDVVRSFGGRIAGGLRDRHGPCILRLKVGACDTTTSVVYRIERARWVRTFARSTQRLPLNSRYLRGKAMSCSQLCWSRRWWISSGLMCTPCSQAGCCHCRPASSKCAVRLWRPSVRRPSRISTRAHRRALRPPSFADIFLFPAVQSGQCAEAPPGPTRMRDQPQPKYWTDTKRAMADLRRRNIGSFLRPSRAGRRPSLSRNRLFPLARAVSGKPSRSGFSALCRPRWSSLRAEV